LLFFSGIVLTSFSDEPKEIQIQIEPPQEEFEDVTKEEEPEPESQPENSGGGGNGPMVYVTGSNYALNGIPILINSPEGLRLNDQLIDQQKLQELEIIHGEKFWERVDQLTYDHYGLAEAMLNPNTQNSFFQNGAKSSQNINSNLDYYVLERGYDPRNLSKVPNNIFVPAKADLARAIMEKLTNPNANDLNIEALNQLDLELLAPNAFKMDDNQKNLMYHGDIENKAISVIQNMMPTISGDTSSESSSDNQNSQNNDGASNQNANPITSMPSGGSSSSSEQSASSPVIPPPKMNEEIFQNTEHIKNIISHENFEPNYEMKDEFIFPIVEILLSIVIFSISTIVGLLIFKKLKNRHSALIEPILVSNAVDYVSETQKLLESSTVLYESNKIKDAYERFSQAIRFYYSYHYNLKREVTTLEILEQIKKKDKIQFKIVYDCLILCRII